MRIFRKVLLALLLIVVLLGLGPCRELVFIAYKTHRVHSPKIYKEAAKQLAICCGSDKLKPEHLYRGIRWPEEEYPKVIRKLKPSSVHVSPEWAYVELGGGFYHYGYKLELNKDNSPISQSTWDLFYFTETKKEKLFSVTLDIPHAIPSPSE